MTTSLAIAIYGAIVSSVLGLLQILKYVRDNRFIDIDATFSWIPNERLDHEIWLMNRGSSSVSVRDLSIGTGIIKGWGRKIEPECSTSMLEHDKDGNPIALVLGPGEAKHFTFSAIALRRQWLELSAINGQNAVRKIRTTQIIEVLHSRSNRWIVQRLDLRDFTEDDIDAFPADKRA